MNRTKPRANLDEALARIVNTDMHLPAADAVAAASLAIPSPTIATLVPGANRLLSLKAKQD